MFLYVYNHMITTNMCTTYYIHCFKSLRCSSGDQQLTGYVVQIQGHFLQLIDQYSLLKQLFLVEVFALALSHYSQSPESTSNVVYSFTALPLELIQYNYDLGDRDCSTITPLSLLPDIHTCCPGSNGSRVAICSMTCIKNFLTVGFPHCLFLTDNTFILIWRVATDFLIWTELCEVIYSSEILKMKIHYEVVQNDISFINRLLMVSRLFLLPCYFEDSVGCLLCG